MSPAPVFNRLPAEFALSGIVGRYLRNVTDHWLKLAPAGNPAMLEMFRDRDRLPSRNLVPWAGEFVGKYITGAVQCWRLGRDRELKTILRGVVDELLTLQAEDGYLGPWPKAWRLANRWSHDPNALNWDTWGHYHVMLGLLLWHEDMKAARALQAACRIADAICDKYLGDRTPRLVDTGSTEMNLAPAHGLAILYRKTKVERYLHMAEQIIADFAARNTDGLHLAGDYLEGTLAGKEFSALPRPRWESLHPIMALAELHAITGEARYRDAFLALWHSMRTGDRHNNGGWLGGEQAQGNPYQVGSIETCCTIAWTAMSVEMLRLTGSSEVADELEMTTLNSGLGLHSPSGKWATYHTPMDGVREASHHSIIFQARAGQPDLNCCSVNAARSIGLLSDWALMQNADGIVLNWYGPGSVRTRLAGVGTLGLTIDSNYPFDSPVSIRISVRKKATFTIALRIPAWSATTSVRVNGRSVGKVKAGAYLPIRRTWRNGDTIALDLDLSLHAWMGEREYKGFTSLYRGPILLTWDRRFNSTDPAQVPELDAATLHFRASTWTGCRAPEWLIDTPSATGETVRLCDFASAGDGGTPYISWLKVRNAERLRRSPFTPDPGVLALTTLTRAAQAFREGKALAAADPAAALRQFQELRNQLPHIRQAVLTARRIVEGRTPTAGKLRALLSAIRRNTPLLSTRLAARLTTMEEAVYTAHPEHPVHPRTLTSFTASVLQPVAPDITRTPYPAPGTARFTPVLSVSNEGFADIRDIHGGSDGLVYVRTTYRSPEAGKGVLCYGADGPVRVWVNGQAAGCAANATNPARANEFAANVTWRAGDNQILLALNTNHGKAWGVYAAACRPAARRPARGRRQRG